jgi:hypothetical protein
MRADPQALDIEARDKERAILKEKLLSWKDKLKGCTPPCALRAAHSTRAPARAVSHAALKEQAGTPSAAATCASACFRPARQGLRD